MNSIAWSDCVIVNTLSSNGNDDVVYENDWDNGDCDELKANKHVKHSTFNSEIENNLKVSTIALNENSKDNV